jgi:ferredoxin
VKVSFDSSHHAPVDLNAGENLSEILTIQNSPVLFGCRTGICGTCLIEVESKDDLPPPQEDERELLEMIAPENPKARLACQVELKSDIRIRYLGNVAHPGSN